MQLHERRKFEWFDRIVRSVEAPNERERVGWLDISVAKRHILKYWLNGEWRPINIYLADIIDFDEDFILGETKDRLYTPIQEEEDDVINCKFDSENIRYIVTSNYQYDEVGETEMQFERTLFEWNITSNDESLGTAGIVSGEPEQYTYVVIEAVPNDEYGRFVSWSDGSTDLRRRIRVTGDLDLQAIFEHITYQINLFKSSEYGVVKQFHFVDGNPENNPSGIYNAGEQVSLHAFANDGYVFGEWVNKDDPTERHSENPYVYTVMSNKNWYATFNKI